MNNIQIQSTDVDTAQIMHQIRARVENKLKNNEYKADIELVNSLGSAITIKNRFEEGFFLLDNLAMLSTSKGGIIGKAIKFIAKRIYWIFYHSLAPVFTVQQDFNREIYTQVKSIKSMLAENEVILIPKNRIKQDAQLAEKVVNLKQMLTTKD